MVDLLRTHDTSQPPPPFSVFEHGLGGRRPSPRPNFEQINQTILQAFPGLLEDWLPGGHIEGGEYVCASLSGGRGDSCKVNIRTGKWADFATSDQKGGDPISLYAAINGLSQGDAARELNQNSNTATASRPSKSENMFKTSTPIEKDRLPPPPIDSSPACVHFKHGTPSMVWRYADAEGKPLQFVARYDVAPGRKEIVPWTWSGTMWLAKGLAAPRPLYGLERLAERPDETVIVCEGEKAADACGRITGAVAVTWSGGSNAVSKTDWAPLQGRRVIVWPDNDIAGFKAGSAVVDMLRSVGAFETTLICPSEKPQKWDAADAEAEGWTGEDFERFLAESGKKNPEDHRPTVTRSMQSYTYDPDFDPSSIPPRPFILRPLLLRGYVSALVSPGAVGKSSFAIALGMSTALGRNLLGYEVQEQVNSMILNNEDDKNEIDRRVSAICQFFEVSFGDLSGRFRCLSGYGVPFIFADQVSVGTVVSAPDTDRLIAHMLENDIAFLVIDPFVSTHTANENDNAAIEQVVTQFRHIAKETNAAVLLIHHTGKTGGGSEAHAGDAEAGRGATSLIWATRVAVTLARMSKDTAKKLGIDPEKGNRLIRLDDAKMNYALKSSDARWFCMESESLPNGDSVGVPVPFDMSKVKEKSQNEIEAKKVKESGKKATEIAVAVAKCMTENEQPQSEVIPAFMERTRRKSSSAHNALGLLPIGLENAIAVMVDAVRTSVWRERHGNSNRPYYSLHKMTED